MTARKHTMKRAESVAFCGLCIALLTVSAWITVPLGPVPFTMQIMMLVFVLLLLPARQALISIFGYVALGALGLPVFSGMAGGLAKLMGPTGGFIVGWCAAALVVVALLKVWHEPQNGKMRVVRAYVASLVFLGITYVCGWVQLMVVANLDPFAAFLAGVAPFIVLDLVKIVVAAGLVQVLKASVPALRKLAGAKA